MVTKVFAYKPVTLEIMRPNETQTHILQEFWWEELARRRVHRRPYDSGAGCPGASDGDHRI